MKEETKKNKESKIEGEGNSMKNEIQNSPENDFESAEENTSNKKKSQDQQNKESLSSVSSKENTEVTNTTPESSGSSEENLDVSDPVDVHEDEKPSETAESEAKNETVEQADNSSGGQKSGSGVEDSDGKTEAVETEIKAVDYGKFSVDQLINTLSILISGRPVQEIRDDVDRIKTYFYKKLRTESENTRKKFIDDGGNEEDFKPEPDPREENFKDLLNKYKSRKYEHNKQLEIEKQANLEEKYRIIEGLKGLINKEESINKTFQEFWEYQKKWRSIGLVPQSKLKDLWENYHYHVEKFYDYIKINKELRDLDLRKNMEAKILLCEKTEALLLKDDSVSNFRILQKYHEQWREIGPVHTDIKEQLWERFKTATAKINKKHQQYYEDLKSTLKKNLEVKTELCEKVERMLEEEKPAHKTWVKKSKEVIEIQKTWKTIGFAPKIYNNQIYERFRKACDVFFSQKREFYAENKELQKNNLQLKMDLCIQAEGVQGSEEWKKTTEELILLQKKWKEIGPVPKKYSEKLWKRFRAACDNFFNRKSEYYSTIDQKYDLNLVAKEELIEKIDKHQFGEDVNQSFKDLKDFQKQWTEIGFVPIKKKEEISQRYRKSIDNLFDKLEIDDEKKNVLRYKNKLENLKSVSRGKDKLEGEREKFVIRLKQLESDIILWENNIGFFAKSKNADTMIKEVSQKIDQAKENLRVLEKKIKMIDDLNL